MKARVKATGEFVEVHTCDEADFVDRNGKYYWEHQLFFGSLDTFPYEDPDYWTKLEHQYAGMAMQGLLTHHGATVNPDWINEEAEAFAHALVEKMKNQSV